MSVTSSWLRKRVSDSAVGFSVTVDSQKPIDYDVVAIGARVTVDAGDKVYFVDVHRTHDNIVDLSVQQRRKAPWIPESVSAESTSSSGCYPTT
jgi:hypothetical protein